jgi:hypothetical protein
MIRFLCGVIVPYLVLFYLVGQYAETKETSIKDTSEVKRLIIKRITENNIAELFKLNNVAVIKSCEDIKTLIPEIPNIVVERETTSDYQVGLRCLITVKDSNESFSLTVLTE